MKDLVAKVLYLGNGTLCFSPALFDHILSLFGSFAFSRSMMYYGAMLFMPLYVSVSIL